MIGTASSLGAQGRGMVSATTRMSAHIGCDAGHTAGPRKLCNVLTSWAVIAKTGGVSLFEGTTTTQPLRLIARVLKPGKVETRLPTHFTGKTDDMPLSCTFENSVHSIA